MGRRVGVVTLPALAASLVGCEVATGVETSELTGVETAELTGAGGVLTGSDSVAAALTVTGAAGCQAIWCPTDPLATTATSASPAPTQPGWSFQRIRALSTGTWC